MQRRKSLGLRVSKKSREDSCSQGSGTLTQFKLRHEGGGYKITEGRPERICVQTHSDYWPPASNLTMVGYVSAI